MLLIFFIDVLKIDKAVFIGHDWGGKMVWRMCMYHPERVFAVCGVCTPYDPPRKTYLSLEAVISRVPQFKYQQFLADTATSGRMSHEIFTQRSTLISETELQYYVEQYEHSKFASACQTYATGKIDFDNELGLPSTIQHRALFIGAAKDPVLKPELAKGMARFVPNLEMKFIEDAGHWVLWEQKEEVNAILSEWLAKISTELGYDGMPTAMEPSVWQEWQHEFMTTPEGIKVHYVDVGPRDGLPVVMVHGWPDLWFGWRNITNDLVALLDALKIEKAVFIGHDWGGNMAWRMCLYHPERVLAVCGVCTPFSPPREQYLSLEVMCGILPQFKYQLFLADATNAGKALDASPRRLLTAIFRGKTEQGPESEVLPLREWLMAVDSDLDHMIFKERSAMISEQEMQYYIGQYAQSKLTSACWTYATRKMDFESEKELPTTIEHPALFIGAADDPVLKPEMASGMPKVMSNLEMKLVKDAGHWVLFEQYEEVNAILSEWLAKISAP
ncbi:hypothetical protein BBJ28_00000079 [Nothophytophthora sp. Chile5]|nr:hypothetical protein BBJ28_00000079 [Nothophytophthora sp. Chile5]